MPMIRQLIEMGDATAGWVIGTAFALGYGATILILALWPAAGRALRKSRMPLGIAIWMVAGAVTGLASSVAELLAARWALGIGQALFIPAALSWIVARSGLPRNRSGGIASFTAGSSLGRSAGLLATGLFLAAIIGVGAGQADAWRWVFVLTVPANVALLAWLLRVQRSDPTGDDVEDEGLSVPRSAQSIYLALATIPVILAQATIGWLPSLFVLDRGLSPPRAAIWLGCVTLVAGPGGQIAGGWLMRRSRRCRDAAPLVVAAAMVGALPWLLLVGWGGSIVVATIGVALLNLSVGIGGFAALFGWQDMMAARHRETGNGIFLALVTTLGVGLGPLMTGMLERWWFDAALGPDDDRARLRRGR